MLTIQELRAMRGSMTLDQFIQQLGPFVLVRKPPDVVESAAAMELAAKGTMLMPKRRPMDGVSLLFEFEDLEIATLPPVGTEEVLTVGRLPDNDVVIDHTSVSKRHVEVRWKDGKCVVVDLNSTNGTLVNDAKVETRSELKDSDIVTIGDVRFCFLLTPTLYRFMASPPSKRRPSGNLPIVSSSASSARGAGAVAKPGAGGAPGSGVEGSGGASAAPLASALQATPRRGNPPPPPPRSSEPPQPLPQIVHRTPTSEVEVAPPVLQPQILVEREDSGPQPRPQPPAPTMATPPRGAVYPPPGTPTVPVGVAITPAPPLSPATIAPKWQPETAALPMPTAPPPPSIAPARTHSAGTTPPPSAAVAASAPAPRPQGAGTTPPPSAPPAARPQAGGSTPLPNAPTEPAPRSQGGASAPIAAGPSRPQGPGTTPAPAPASRGAAASPPPSVPQPPRAQGSGTTPPPSATPAADPQAGVETRLHRSSSQPSVPVAAAEAAPAAVDPQGGIETRIYRTTSQEQAAVPQPAASTPARPTPSGLPKRTTTPAPPASDKVTPPGRRVTSERPKLGGVAIANEPTSPSMVTKPVYEARGVPELPPEPRTELGDPTFIKKLSSIRPPPGIDERTQTITNPLKGKSGPPELEAEPATEPGTKSKRKKLTEKTVAETPRSKQRGRKKDR